MTLYFAIRDDDVCYHTDPKILETIYGNISKKCPISFSCIPYVGGYDIDNYDEKQWGKYDKAWIKWQTKEVFPIGENKELVKFLKKWCHQNRATLMLHGVNHHLNEFTKLKEFDTIIKQAKNYLEKVFAREIFTCSPPNNSLNRASSKALAKLNLNILTSFGHLPNEREFSYSNVKNFFILLFLFIRHKRRIRLTKPLNFKTHLEQPCYGLGPNTNFKEVMEGLKNSIRYGGNFVIALHYYQIASDKVLLNNLLELIEYAEKQKKREVKFVAAEEIFVEH